jgi:hypothetical protein
MILIVENLFVEKRRKRLHIGEYKGIQKTVILWIRVGSGGFIAFFCIA